MKILRMLDNGIVQSFALVSLWIVHDHCDSVEWSLVQQNFKIFLVVCASWHLFPLSTLLNPFFVDIL